MTNARARSTAMILRRAAPASRSRSHRAQLGGRESGPRLHARDASKLEHGVQTAVHADQHRYPANGEQRSIDIGTSTAPRIMAEREPLIRHSEDDLGTDHEARHAQGMNLRSR